MRFRITIDVFRHVAPEPERQTEREPEPEPPRVDGKGAFLLERSHQDAPDDMRSGITEHWYRIGFRPNEERE